MRDGLLPYLHSLHHWTGQTVYLGVLRQFEVVYLEKVARSGEAARLPVAGSRVPANCTAIGKALLAHQPLDELADLLPERLPALTPKSITDASKLMAQLRVIRQGELARACEEARPGVACIAAPIVIKGWAVGAVAVSHPVDEPLNPRTGTALLDITSHLVKDDRASVYYARARWNAHEYDR
jgi:DNA-binding IclR family transcriptional regulator